jgi:hypothetical protein
MLKPYVCVNCERVIIEQAEEGPAPEKIGTASLIGLFSKIYVQATSTASGEPVQLPPAAVIPHRWAIYSEWEAQPGDEHRQYQLLAQVLYPDGKPFGETARVPMIITPGQRSRVVVRINAFPVGQQGTYIARVWIEENGKKEGGTTDLKIEVVTLPVAPPSKAGQST